MKQLSKNKLVLLQIIGFWVIIVLLVFSANIFMFDKVKQQFLQDTEETSLRLGKNVETKLSENFKTLRVTTKYIQESDLKNPENLITKLSEVREKNGYRKIAIALLDGKSYATNGEIYNVVNREYFQHAKEGNEYISNVLYSLDDETQVNVFAVPVYGDEQEVIGVIWASLDTEVFSESIHVTSEDIDLYLIDNQGNLVAGRSQEDNFYEVVSSYDGNEKALRTLQSDMKQNKSGYQFFDYKDKEVYMYYNALDNNTYTNDMQWWLLLRVPASTIHSMAETSTSLLNKISVVICFLFTLNSYVFFYKYKKSNKDLKTLVYTDTITNGYNDRYLQKILTHYKFKRKYHAFIKLSIHNLSEIMNIQGLKGSEYIVNKVYHYLQEYLGKSVVISHSHFGEFKFILSFDTKEEIIKRLENIRLDSLFHNISILKYI